MMKQKWSEAEKLKRKASQTLIRRNAEILFVVFRSVSVEFERSKKEFI